MRITCTLAIALLLATVAAPLLAQQQRVYQWKDANGVTHYADTEPTAGHKTRDIDAHSGTATIPSAAKPVENEQCTNARANTLRLQGSGAVGMDINGDGKPDRNLSADERKSQLELNQAAVKAFCSPSKS